MLLSSADLRIAVIVAIGAGIITVGVYVIVLRADVAEAQRRVGEAEAGMRAAVESSSRSER